jgi:hypothetical protein
VFDNDLLEESSDGEFVQVVTMLRCSALLNGKREIIAVCRSGVKRPCATLMATLNSLPYDTLHRIFDTACEIELFDETENPSIRFYWGSFLNQGRRLKPFAFRASRACALWRTIVKSSSLFWIAELRGDLEDLSVGYSSGKGMQGCDIDIHSGFVKRISPRTLLLFGMHVFPLLDRARVLCVATETGDEIQAIVNQLGQSRLLRLPALFLKSERNCCIESMPIPAPGLHHVKLEEISWSDSDGPFQYISSMEYKYQERSNLPSIDIQPKIINLIANNSLFTLSSLWIRVEPLWYVFKDDNVSIVPPNLFFLTVHSDFCNMLRCLGLLDAPNVRKLDLSSLPRQYFLIFPPKQTTRDIVRTQHTSQKLQIYK